MNVFTAVLLGTTALATLTIAAYWTKRRQKPPVITIALIVAGLALTSGSILLDRTRSSFAPSVDPVAILIAFDLSPSMLAIPDPTLYPGVQPRYLRARQILQDVLKALEERGAAVTVALLGFSKDAEIMMGWDSSVSQLREILQYGLSPDLFTSSGTRIEAAVETVIEVFDMLPAEQKDRGRKVTIFVSDGEDTSSGEYLRYAIAELAEHPFDIVALQAGILGVNEGVPRFSPAGEFLGFDVMSGNVYSTPDANTMLTMSRSGSARGLYVRSEQAGSAAEIIDFLAGKRSLQQNISTRFLITFLLLCVSVLLCARALR